jgi:hypothetical protein
MGATQIREWFNRFKDGHTLADSDQRSGRPSTSQNANAIENVRSLILDDRRLTIQEISDEVGISTGSAHSIVTEDLHMCRVVAKSVPKLLSQEQKQLHLEVARDMLECTNGDPEFLKTVITGDETWVYGYDPENEGAVIAVEAFFIPKAQKNTTDAEQSQGAPNCFLSLPRDCASQLCTRRPNYQQRTLSGSHPSSSRCSSAQETEPLGLTQLAVAA